MAIRAPGQYVTKRANKKGRSHHKENRFLKKRFFTLSSSSVFPVAEHGKTCVTRLRARQNLAPALVGRTFNVNQGDLNSDNKETHRNFRFKVGTVKGTNCVGFFNGMYVARDRITSMVKKWHTLVEADTAVTTRDGSEWRVFAIAVTRRPMGETKKTVYLQSSQVKKIRRAMLEVIEGELGGIEVDRAVEKLSTEALGKKIEARCAEIHPMSAIISKVKPIKNMKIVRAATLARDEESPVELLQEN